MKYLACLLVTTILTANASANTLFDEYKTPAIACGVAIVGATALGGSMAVGAGVCAGVATYHYLTKEEAQGTKFLVNDLLEKQANGLKTLREETHREYQAYREAIREIVVESVGKKDEANNELPGNIETIKAEILKEAQVLMEKEKERIIDEYVKGVMGK